MTMPIKFLLIIVLYFFLGCPTAPDIFGDLPGFLGNIYCMVDWWLYWRDISRYLQNVSFHLRRIHPLQSRMGGRAPRKQNFTKKLQNSICVFAAFSSVFAEERLDFQAMLMFFQMRAQQ